MCTNLKFKIGKIDNTLYVFQCVQRENFKSYAENKKQLNGSKT